ncbi:hypothetical protein NEUTE1DRAFT_125873 [Neurospora tetrasperma FGSC 2508]|uniref:Ribosomal protein s17 n=1 Tax=Neurospora tetrasperma (strain FGSC 2508 / ATCC MYA-4615 / P0657) TaxID=510951 RepID=F8N1U4_NEUT8|nr:uncharacterized protein NEUTE1DRAFT_125873 [Neurospora tetrasperma FGSC 2508]EGO52371.1 hypothetical protein NEUTE1DRAFT_125873 [Neurospora tetrasperma FGSC 2508]
MLMKTALTALLGLAMVTDAAIVPNTDFSTLEQRQNRNGKFGGGNRNQGGNAGNNANKGGNNQQQANTCLAPGAIQTGSASTGQSGAGAADGQVNSKTDKANFINFCNGQTLTNGQQIKSGSCNGIPMGKIPSTDRMISAVILNPKNNDNIQASKTFTIQVKLNNIALGSFTNATSTYYSAPQDVDGSGRVIGHTHVTVQNTGNTLNPTEPLDARQFAFFKGINDAGNGAGTLSTDVTGGLPAGNYRICTMTSASNHQPVLMPVAQRGAQDDCRYFTVSNNGGGGGGGNNNNNGGNNANKNNNNNNNNNNNKNTGNNNTGGRNRNSGKNVATSQAIAGISAPAVTNSGNSQRPFAVNGATFVNKAAAVQRACAIQNNACANAVNSGKASGVTLQQCNAQETACRAAGGA